MHTSLAKFILLFGSVDSGNNRIAENNNRNTIEMSLAMKQLKIGQKLTIFI